MGAGGRRGLIWAVTSGESGGSVYCGVAVGRWSGEARRAESIAGNSGEENVVELVEKESELGERAAFGRMNSGTSSIPPFRPILGLATRLDDLVIGSLLPDAEVVAADNLGELDRLLGEGEGRRGA